MNKKVITFLTILVLACFYPYYKVIDLGMDKGKFYVILIMWIPALVAIITNLIFEKKLPSFGLKRFFTKEIGIAYIIPLISSIIVYGTVYLTGLGGTAVPIGATIPSFIMTATLGVVVSSLTAIGEELGWRGYLVPELMKKYSYVKVSIIVGTIWLLYHLPILIFSNYNNGVSILSSVIFFTISIYAVTFIANLLTIKSNTVWPAIMLHSVHNVLVQGFFDPLTVDKGITKFITTEFGCGLALMYTIVAIVLYFNNRKSINY